MTGWILTAIGLYFIQCMLGPASRWLFGKRVRILDALGSRDVQPEQSKIGGRLERAALNMQEALFLFLPLALLAEMKGLAATHALEGAKMFVLARVAYVPAYASGLFGIRSIVWMVGHAGLIMMAAAIIASL